MLKKAISFSIVLLLLFLVYQFLVVFIKHEHDITYVVNSDELYNVEEKYSKDKEDFYTFKVTTSDNEVFLFEVDNSFNKQKEIIKDIISFKNDNIKCLTLLFKDDITTEPICQKNGELMAFSYVKNDADFSEYIEKIPNFDLNKYDKGSERREEYDLSLNTDYLDDNETIIVYSYKKVGFYDKKVSKYLTFSVLDNYKNIMGSVVGKYYVIPYFNATQTITQYLKYNLETGSDERIDLTSKLSKQTYINGVYNDKLYLFDKSDMKQYTFDPYKEEITLIGDESKNGFAYINGKEQEISVYDLNNGTVKFSDNADDYKDLKYDSIFICEKYAIIYKDGAFYKVYKDYLDRPILLLKEENAQEIKMKYGNIYYIKDDSIYRYNKYGSVSLITRNELKYNTDNVFDVYVK